MDHSFHTEPKNESKVFSEEVILNDKGCTSSNISSPGTTLLNKAVTTTYTQQDTKSKFSSSSPITTTLNENVGGEYCIEGLT